MGQNADDDDDQPAPFRAAEKIKEEGTVLKSTGKPVPVPLIGAIVLGSAAAAGSYFLNGGAGVSSEEEAPSMYTAEEQKERFETYEKESWVNNVELPWMKPQEPEADEEASE